MSIERQRVHYPKHCHTIQSDWPLFVDTLKRTRSHAENGTIRAQTHNALLPIIQACDVEVKYLNGFILKHLLTQDNNSLKRLVKTILSLRDERNTMNCSARLRRHVQILTYQQV